MLMMDNFIQRSALARNDMNGILFIDVNTDWGCHEVYNFKHVKLSQLRKIAFQLIRRDPFKSHSSAQVRLLFLSELAFCQTAKLSLKELVVIWIPVSLEGLLKLEISGLNQYFCLKSFSILFNFVLLQVDRFKDIVNSTFLRFT